MRPLFKRNITKPKKNAITATPDSIAISKDLIFLSLSINKKKLKKYFEFTNNSKCPYLISVFANIETIKQVKTPTIYATVIYAVPSFSSKKN